MGAVGLDERVLEGIHKLETPMSIAATNITAEEYAAMPKGDRPSELVRGNIVPLNQELPRHGKVCLRLGAALDSYLSQHDIGQAFSNDTGIITTRSPDSVRGPDISYFSYDRLPKSASLDTYPNAPPNIAFEVRSPSDRLATVIEKIDEYLAAGVDFVTLLDPLARQATVYSQDQPKRILGDNDVLVFPSQLPGLEIGLHRLFE